MWRTVFIRYGIVVALAFVTVLENGCASTGGRLISTLSPEVSQIPTTIGIYPILSTPAGRRGGVSAIMVKRAEDRIYVVPPTESKLVVTSLSQVMTGLISNDLLYYGFDLRELPVEIPEEGSTGAKKDKTFTISLSLLEHLREHYNIQAILIGNAFFVVDPYSSAQTQVLSGHLKLIDSATLKVLCQVSLTYDEYGKDINDVAEAMAAELASMAGLINEEKE